MASDLPSGNPESSVSLLPNEPEIDAPRGLRAPGTARMIAGSLIGAVLAYLFQVYGTRALGAHDFSRSPCCGFVLHRRDRIRFPLDSRDPEASRGRQVLKEDRVTIAFVIVGVRRYAGDSPT